MSPLVMSFMSCCSTFLLILLSNLKIAVSDLILQISIQEASLIDKEVGNPILQDAILSAKLVHRCPRARSG